MMKILRILQTALRALRRNPMRAALTTLGIVIGVAAVIAMMEIGAGSASAIQRTISSMGANTIMLLPGNAATGGVSFGAGTAVTLTPQDGDAIRRECPAVAITAPVVRARAQVVYGNKNYVPGNIYGTTPDYLEAQNWGNLDEGECFTESDVRNASKVCLVGRTLVKELFEGQSPVGREIRVRNIAFKVVGVLRAKGANMMGFDQDDVLLAPWTTIKYRVTGQSAGSVNQSAAAGAAASVNTLSQLYPNTQMNLYPAPSDVQSADTPQPVRFTNVDQIIVAARSPAEIQPAIRQITNLLRQRHHLRDETPDDFNIRNMTAMIEVMTSTSVLMTKLLLCVALISLIVGGVGIMNIMLVSVTERTREIGLRMAVGARARDILRQFLVEAIVLCVAGGIMGILIGRGVSIMVTLLLQWPTETSIGAIVASVMVSASVGIVFGYYPAWKAANLDPIEALRYE